MESNCPERSGLALKLTNRQVKFAEKCAAGTDPVQAAAEAGYSPKTALVQAKRLLRDEDVCAYIRECETSLREKDEVTPEWVNMKFAEIVERCMEGKPHMNWNKATREWEPDGTWTFDVSGSVQALTAIGKSLGMFGGTKNAEQPQSGETLEAYLEKNDSGAREF